MEAWLGTLVEPDTKRVRTDGDKRHARLPLGLLEAGAEEVAGDARGVIEVLERQGTARRYDICL